MGSQHDAVIAARYRLTVALMRAGRRYTDHALAGLGLEPQVVRLMVAL